MAFLCDVYYFVKGALEATRARRIDVYGDQSGAHATKKRADNFEPRRVGEQDPVLRRETTLFPQVSGDRPRPPEKRRVGVAFDWIAVQVNVRIQKFVRLLVSQPIQLV